MRLVLVLVLLAACGGKPASGPAWPKQSEKETDGGESLAPRAKAAAVAAAADDDEPVADVTPSAEKKDAAKTDATDAAKPAATTPSQSIEDIIMSTEEIIIEIDD